MEGNLDPGFKKNMAHFRSERAVCQSKCLRTELITLAASSVGTWATLVSSRDRLTGDILWGDGITCPRYTTPRWVDDEEQKVLIFLWATGCKAVVVISAGHTGGLNAQAVRTRANRFVAKTTVTHSDHRSVTVF